jgi:RES domain-containing protein
LKLYRITRRIHVTTPLDGEGSRLFGGRWSSVGLAVAYASATLSLAALEYLVHVDPDILPRDLVAVHASADGCSVESLDLATLPANWREYPAPAALPHFGDEWVRSGRSLLLTVPSVIIPEERNVLINPRHEEASLLKVSSTAPFSFDRRLFTRRSV